MRRAFTLVELLVVIGLITVLVGVLLPALSVARRQARSVQCLSNLRQMAVVAQAYVYENRGLYPVAYWDSESWDFSTIDGKVVPGLLWEHRGPTAVQQCPEFEGEANSPGDPYTGYNYNTSYIGHGQFEAVPAPMKAGQLRHSSRTALFGDGQWSGGADKYMRCPFPSPGETGLPFVGRFAGTQGFRHRGRTNVAFCDGHAESLPDRYAQSDPLTISLLAPGTGFLSADNSAYSGQ